MQLSELLETDAGVYEIQWLPGPQGELPLTDETSKPGPAATCSA
jgi:hypothetical protein